MKNKSFRITGLAVMALALVAVACAPSETAAPVETGADPLAADGAPAPAAELPAEPANPGYCGNAFYPVAEGRFWDYLLTAEETASNMRFTHKDVSQDAFTLVQTTSDITTEIRWQCGPDGLLSGANASISIAPIPNMEIETLEVEGVVIPAADKWQVGYTWDTNFTVRLTMTLGDSQIEGEGIYVVSSTIAGIEPVSVPAGSYENAYRVDAVGSYTFTIMDVENTFTSTSSSWFVEGIGMVKNASSEPGMAGSMELTALGGA